MKTLSFLLLLVSFTSHAQTGADTDAYVFSDVVIADSLLKDELYRNAITWVKGEKDKTIILAVQDSTDGKLSGSSSFPVYSQTGIMQKLSGRIGYDFSVEVKDGKYRYAFEHFIFHYYVQDRNYKWVDNGKTKPLTESNATGWQKLWNKHRLTTTTAIIADIDRLKAQMKYRAGVKVKVIKKAEW